MRSPRHFLSPARSYTPTANASLSSSDVGISLAPSRITWSVCEEAIVLVTCLSDVCTDGTFGVLLCYEIFTLYPNTEAAWKMAVFAKLVSNHQPLRLPYLTRPHTPYYRGWTRTPIQYTHRTIPYKPSQFCILFIGNRLFEPQLFVCCSVQQRIVKRGQFQGNVAFESVQSIRRVHQSLKIAGIYY